MFKIIYRLRLLVQENSQYFPIHLCALKEKEPTFNDLMRKIECFTENINLNDYYLATVDNNIVLYDDQSLQNALESSTSDQQRLEIILCRKKSCAPTTTTTDDLHLMRRKVSGPKIIHLNPNSPAATDVPVIKPTVLRWTPAILPNDSSNNNNMIRRYSSISQDDYSIDCRKDSGISLDEPHRKKQRVMSADHHPRKLPDPSSSPLPSLRNNSITSLHPLEIRRPSTAPPSCSPPTSPFPRSQHYIPPTLPAISSITSSTHQQTLDSQLAPIHNKPAATVHNLYHPSANNNKRTRSNNNNNNNHSNSIFLCEHVNDHGKVCGQTFRRSYDLSRHQTIHLENRPFCYCDKCGKKFTRMDALRRHERVQGHSSSKQRSMSTSIIPQQKTSV